MNFSVEKIVPMIASFGVRIVGALAVLFFAWIVAGIVKRQMIKRFEKAKFEPSLSKFFASLVRYTILIGALLGVLGLFGVETTSFAAVIAAAGLAIGLAFKSSLSNFAAGLMLLAFRPFKVGDLVVVASQLGFVKEIELFTTELATLDNRRIIVPNDTIFGSVIENLTHHPTRRVDVPVGVEYGAEIDKTREVLEGAVKEVPGVLLEPPSQVFLVQLGESSVDWQLRVWCNTKEYWTVHEATVRAAKSALENAGLAIPFPQMDVHLDKP